MVQHDCGLARKPASPWLWACPPRSLVGHQKEHVNPLGSLLEEERVCGAGIWSWFSWEGEWSQAQLCFHALLFYLFSILFLAVLGLRCCTGFSLVVVSRATRPAWVLGHAGLSSCSSRALSTGSEVHTGLTALWHVGSSIRNGLCVPCIGR